MKDYFESIVQGSAQVEVAEDKENKEDNPIKKINLHVDIQALKNEKFTSEIKEMLKTHPHGLFESFRKKSKTINFTTAECIQKLQSVKEMIKDAKIEGEISSKIDALLLYIDEDGLKEEKHRFSCSKLISSILLLEKDIREPRSKVQRVGSYISSIFSASQSLTKKEKDIQGILNDALTDLNKMINKQYVFKSFCATR